MGYEEYFYIQIIIVLLSGLKKFITYYLKKLLKIHIESDGNMRIFTIQEIN